TMLSAAGTLWTIGGLPDPSRINAEAGHRRIPLPTYPFERKRYWVDRQTDTASPHVAAEPTVASSPNAYAVTWTRCSGSLRTRARVPGRWLVVGGAQSLRRRVADGLGLAGASVEVLDGPDADLQNPETVTGAFALFPTEPSGPERAFEAYKEFI